RWSETSLLITEAQDLLLLRAAFRACRCRAGFAARAIPQLPRSRGIVKPAPAQSRQRKVDFSPLWMAIRLEGREVLAQRACKTRKMCLGVFQTVIVRHQVGLHRQARQVSCK